MRSYNVNPDGTGNDAESDYINRNLKRSTELQFFSSGTVKVQQTTRGTRFIAKIPPPSQPGAPAVAMVLPFQIYRINNLADPTKNTQTFQVRDGLVGFRPSYVYPGETISTMRQHTANGNYEMPLFVAGTDGLFSSGQPWQFATAGDVDFSQVVSANIGGSVIFDGTTNPLLICSTQAGSAKPTGVQIVINPGGNAFFQISFWIKIIDGPAGVYTELWASRANGAGVPNFAASAIANLAQTIGIGLVTFEGGQYIISQCQYGHLFNRYLEFSPNPTLPVADGSAGGLKFSGLPQVHRGKWTANALSGKIFYPGDQVINDTVSFNVGANPPGPLFSVYKIWTYLGGQDAFGNTGIKTEAVSPALGNWTPTGICTTT